MILENYFAFGAITLLFLFGLVSLIAISKNTIISLYNYFFNKWEITIKEEGEETWHQEYPIPYLGQKVENSEYSRDYVIYLYKNKYNKEEKLVKKYLD